jgi:aldehyde:ferredoxin oxidoreductase
MLELLQRMLIVDMAALTVRDEKLPEAYRHLSGRSLSSRYIYDNVPALAEPLGPNNRLVLTGGLLAGTTVSCANRLSVGAKSPLTGGIKESNAGGVAAYKMGRLGLRLIAVTGIREDDAWYILLVRQAGAELVRADELVGLGLTDKARLLRERYGDNIGLTLIGPAGEKRLLTAGVASSDMEGVPARFSGRGGLGAVMGAKHLLGVIFDDSGCRPAEAAVPEAFAATTKEFHGLLLANPQTAEIFPKYGTAAMVDTTNSLGGLPTRNFSTGAHPGAGKFNGAALHQTISERGGAGKPTHACMPGCLVRCSNIYPDRDGKMLVTPLEYESIGLLGPNLDIDDLDTIAAMNRICNDCGVDTIEIGCAIGVAMEAGVLPFGDRQAALDLMKEVAADTYLGRIIASGSTVAGKVFGIRRVPAVKGQGMAAYEPRAVKGTGVTYMTTPMGADHTAGNVVRANLKHHLKDQQVPTSQGSQLGMSMIDGLGFCMMIAPALKDRTLLADMVNAYHGWRLTLADLEAVARDTLLLEKKFNTQAGLTLAHDRLPEHFYQEENPASKSRFDIDDADIEGMLYYK